MKTCRTLGSLAVLYSCAALADSDLREIVKEHRLSNGMKWLIVERPEAPVFTGFIRVKAGGADEEPGYTGLAHLFEHMAFKGTPVLGTNDFEAEKKLLLEIAKVGDAIAPLERANKGHTEEAQKLRNRLSQLQQAEDKIADQDALSKLYELNGAQGLNATTDKDLTSYFVSLPRNRLELWSLVEASRLVSPVLRGFYKERDVVMEERRLRVDSDPGGLVYEELNQVAFTASPYRWPVVGYAQDLEAMTLKEGQGFHEHYYVPANSVGCLVGDLKFSEVVPLLERTFGAIPASPPPPPLEFGEPESRYQRRSTVFFDASPRLMLGFRKPTLPDRDDYVFDVLQILLGQGRTARLHRRLVLKDRTAQAVGAFGGPGARLNNLFIIAAIPLNKTKVSSLETTLWEELNRLKTEKVSEKDLQQIRNRVIVDRARTIESNSGLAETLSYFEAVAGDWRYVADHPKQIESITAEDVQRVAKKYFTVENSVVVDLARPDARPRGSP
jgi:predicted Zn-dependent peptidase